MKMFNKPYVLKRQGKTYSIFLDGFEVEKGYDKETGTKKVAHLNNLRNFKYLS